MTPGAAQIATSAPPAGHMAMSRPGAGVRGPAVALPVLPDPLPIDYVPRDEAEFFLCLL